MNANQRAAFNQSSAFLSNFKSVLMKTMPFLEETEILNIDYSVVTLKHLSTFSPFFMLAVEK